MKKIILSLMAFMFLTLASNAAGVGYVNYNVISQNYPLARKYTTDLNNKVNAIKTYTKQREDAVAKAKSAQEKSNIKKAALVEIEKKQKDYLATRDKYEIDLTKKINAAVEKVRVQKKLDIVLNKEAVITGGVDITQSVIAILK